MITKIILDNTYKKGEKVEIELPKTILVNKKSSFEDWDNLAEKVKVISELKQYFKNPMNIFPTFISDDNKESIIEIQMDWEGKSYHYSTVYYKGSLVMENLLSEGSWIFSRLRDNPDFALDSTQLSNEILYNAYKGIFTLYAIQCFIPGIELLKELENIIIVDEWYKLTRDNYLHKYKEKFPKINLRKIINKIIIENLGFSDEFDKIDDTYNYLYTKRGRYRIPLECAGSGFRWLCFIVPLMIAAKQEDLLLVSSIPLDKLLHPNLGKALMNWYLKDNLNVPICRLQNVIL